MKSKSRKSTHPRPAATHLSRFVRPRPAFVFVTCLGIWLPRGQAATLINLDATQLPAGPLNTWTNTGAVVGNFAPNQATNPPVVTTVDGVKGIQFSPLGGGA